jgi:hypothetical protein
MRVKMNGDEHPRIKTLRRRNPRRADEVRQEAALIAAEKGSPVITDNIARIAQRREWETRARHNQPSRRQLARGEEGCNRAEWNLASGEGGEMQEFSLLDTLLPRIETPLTPRNGVSIFHLDIAKLSADAQALLRLLVEHEDEVRRIEENPKLKNQTRKRNEKILGAQRKLAYAISESAPAAKSELQGAFSDLIGEGSTFAAMEMNHKLTDRELTDHLLAAAISQISPSIKAELQHGIELERAASGADREDELRAVKHRTPAQPHAPH